MLRGELREGEEAEGRQVRDRLVHVPRKRREIDGVVDERELELVMLCAEVLRDVPGVGELAPRS